MHADGKSTLVSVSKGSSAKVNYFYEIFKFRDFMNTLRNFVKSVLAHIFAKFESFEKVIIYSKSPDQVL